MLLFLFGLLVYYTLHSLLASNSVKAWLIKKILLESHYRLVYNALAIVLLLPIVLQYLQLDKSLLFILPLWLRISGNILLIVGILLLYLALRGYALSEFLGIYQYRHKKEMPVEELRTSGLNQYVRHPLYFATLLIVWGAFLANSHYPMLAIASITTLYLFIGTKLEEKKLIHVFGKKYQQYQEKVPMLLPAFFAKRK